jgi:hypothetical protein
LRKPLIRVLFSLLAVTDCLQEMSRGTELGWRAIGVRAECSDSPKILVSDICYMLSGRDKPQRLWRKVLRAVFGSPEKQFLPVLIVPRNDSEEGSGEFVSSLVRWSRASLDLVKRQEGGRSSRRTGDATSPRRDLRP